MTQTQTKKTPPQQSKRVKLRAMQQMFYDNRIVEEGEVFMFEGPQLPADFIAQPASEEAPLGLPPAKNEPQNNAPSWTTKGFVDQANHNAGRRGAEG